MQKWNEMVGCIKRIAKNIFGKSEGDGPPCKGRSCRMKNTLR